MIDQLSAKTADTTTTANAAPQVKANAADDKNSKESMKNEFISLMVAQIQNQDPLNPMDGTQYVSQLAQFSQVESMENMSSMLQNSNVRLDNMQVLSTAGLVGQTVYVAGNDFDLGSSPQSGKVELDQDASQLNLLVQDQYGQSTKVALGPHKAGDVDFAIDPKKLGLSPGKYQVSVETAENQPQPKIMLSGKVEQVQVPSSGSNAGSTLVNIQGVGSVPFYNIAQFGA
ncbi:flagellar basal-body rod modification protein FlgD [Vibrio xiamenensis]|uniref:Basal-body rod modification protein FlgD n=1 Tax=Vibrio xiamenensis TaxID=861298 RepID=A0A1G7Y3D9_9VIBR|nr:flagellar hook assembly protein FlgD [Vibrio xiamenensis]SDG90929.1 flagellar basal-body rod modification protein FlgD [Vibrio xiamenensis]